MNKRLRGRTPFVVCAVAVLLAAAIFVCRLADWQLIHGAEYKRLSTRSTSFNVDTEPTRGEILDRNGVGLVTNITHYKIVIDKLFADGQKLDSTLLRLMDLVRESGDEWVDDLPILLSGGEYSFKPDSDEAISALKEELELKDDASARQCVELLYDRYEIDKSLPDEQKRALASVRYNMDVQDYSNANPYTFASDVSRDCVSAVSENTQGVGGVDVQTYLVRTAKDPTLAPHVLGALGAISEEEYDRLSHSVKEYGINDTVGKFGIELAYEEELKGEGGTKIIQRNSDGTVVEVDRAMEGSTSSLLLKAQFDNSSGILIPGMFARARLVGDTIKDAILVPQRSVQQLLGKSFVIIVGEGNKSVVAPVELGETVGSYYVIKKGLNGSEQVVVEGLTNLTEGVEMNVTTVSADDMGFSFVDKHE